MTPQLIATLACFLIAAGSLICAITVRTRLALSLKRQRGLLRNNSTLSKTVDHLADVAQDQNDRVIAALSEVCAGLKAYAEDRNMRAAELADVLLGVHKLLADEPEERSEEYRQIDPDPSRPHMWKGTQF